MQNGEVGEALFLLPDTRRIERKKEVSRVVIDYGRDHKRNRNENEVGKRMEREGEKNAKRVKKKRENCRRKIFALPVDKRWQIINNGLVYVAVRRRSFASQFCPDSWLDHRLPRENRFLFFETAETKLYFTFKTIVSRFDKIILTWISLQFNFLFFVRDNYFTELIIVPNKREI